MKKTLAGLLVMGCSGIDLSDWVDIDTPESAFYLKNGDGVVNTIVFSDEFNEDGRTFEDGADPKWTALSRPDTVNAPLTYYLPEMITTKNGFLNITTINEPFTWKGFNDQTQAWDTFTRHYKSGMIQSWNKFCFTGGVIEMSVQLPGTGNLPGLWPAAWLVGNLGRATYTDSTAGMWPWSFDQCPANLDVVRGQRVSACTLNAPPGLNQAQGRGAPEIDIFEAMTFWGWGEDSPNVFTTSLQIAPALPANIRPFAFNWPGPGQWYQGLQYYGSEPNIAFYGSALGDAISASKTMPTTTLYTTQHVFRLEWEPGPAGYIRWYLDGEPLFEIPAWSLGQWYEGLPPKLMINEPMYMIFNTAMSGTWSSVCGNVWAAGDGTACPPGDHSGCCAIFPAHMLIDYIRVYQDLNNPLQTLGCSPPGFPTAEYIAKSTDYGPPLKATPPLKPRASQLLVRWVGPVMVGAGLTVAALWVLLYVSNLWCKCFKRRVYEPIGDQ